MKIAADASTRHRMNAASTASLPSDATRKKKVPNTSRGNSMRSSVTQE
jgi:hypothetical protein